MALEFSVDGNPSSFGNHFIVGLSGLTLSDADKRMLSEVRPVGVLLLKRNLDHSTPYPEWLWTLQALLAEVRYYTEREELFVSIDHEGERVQRTPPPMTVFPNAAVFAPRAAEVARAQAIELRSLGVNVSWAPVADIHSNPFNPIIGQRAFGTTATSVSQATVPYLRTMTEQGIIGCAKHFPGHGDTSTDSHLELPVLNLTEDELVSRELGPFKALIDAGVPLIMTAHILYPKIDPQYPATMSQKIIGDILRKKLEFKGVVVTDDLDMKAVAQAFNEGTMIGRALAVGCDMFIVARNQQEATGEDRTVTLAKNLAEALRRKQFTEEQLYATFSRINKLFEEILPDNQPHALNPALLEQHQRLANELRGGELRN